MELVQKALEKLTYCPSHLQMPLYAFIMITWLSYRIPVYVSKSRYYVVCTSHILEANRMISEDEKGST